MPHRVRAICIHGHFYQPPREDPWLGVLLREASAAPDRDWNARILRECYAPNAAARLLDRDGLVRAVLDNYAWISFNVGPTLCAWMASAAPEFVASLRRADARSSVRLGHGNAWAQPYNHPILPLCTPRDRQTQIAWGVADFVRRFGRVPDGIWLPEMAVDVGTLEAVAAAGISLTMLSPHQAKRVRRMGSEAEPWRAVTAETLDVRRLYRASLPSGRRVDIVFRDATLSQGLAFGELLRDGSLLVARAREALGDGEGLVTLATDGETFGHHHRFGEMAVAYAIDALRRSDDIQVMNPQSYRAQVPVSDEVEIVEASSWSCAHGVERWRADCGCRVGGGDGSQAWRTPLRTTIDWLRDVIDRTFEETVGAMLATPWAVRDRYGAVVVGNRTGGEFLDGLAPGAGWTVASRSRALCAFEMARHGMLMQTSCGWFFDDVAGLEAALVIRQAGRAAELAAELGVDVRGELVDRLGQAQSNDPRAGTGADVYQRVVAARPVSRSRVAACAAMLEAMGTPVDLPGYRCVVERDGERRRVRVTERATETTEEIEVAPETAARSASRWYVAGKAYGPEDLFEPQRDQMADRIVHDVEGAVSAARHHAVAQHGLELDAVLRTTQVPGRLAAIVARELGDAVVAAEASGGDVCEPLRRIAALRESTELVLEARVASAAQRRLLATLERLPEEAAAAAAILEAAGDAGVSLDVAEAQVAFVRWWATTESGAGRLTEVLETLRVRLGVAPCLEGD